MFGGYSMWGLCRGYVMFGVYNMWGLYGENVICLEFILCKDCVESL
jgi:hypothetical protein